MAFNLAFTDPSVVALASLLRPIAGDRLLGTSANPHVVLPATFVRRDKNTVDVSQGGGADPGAVAG